MRSGRKAVEDAREAEEAAELAEWQAQYGAYEDPLFASFVGANHICGTCGAVAAEMAKHLAWHAAS